MKLEHKLELAIKVRFTRKNRKNNFPSERKNPNTEKYIKFKCLTGALSHGRNKLGITQK